jgi:hypothetical protein
MSVVTLVVLLPALVFAYLMADDLMILQTSPDDRAEISCAK